MILQSSSFLSFFVIKYMLLSREGADDMGEFIQNNTLWLTPIISIILTIVFKISAKPEFLTLGFIDYLDFGFDLAISSIIVLLAGAKDNTGIWLLLFAFILIMITSILVNRLGWDKSTKQQRIIGIIIPDIVGIFLLVIASLYAGGVIR